MSALPTIPNGNTLDGTHILGPCDVSSEISLSRDSHSYIHKSICPNSGGVPLQQHNANFHYLTNGIGWLGK